MTSQYLSFGIVDARTHSYEELAMLRTVELARSETSRRRWRTLRLRTR
ncbi:hypothetical protein [Nocardioides coralli]|nr:hypothetical protein [Nocardioides coralli]QZY27705.1 hypothetical protein K6T13_09240 [Nocardioides coralli]